MTVRQTLEQRRARDAWGAVQAVRGAKKSGSGDYKREAKRLPVRILTAGLGHALAFANCKKGGDGRVADDVAKWVLSSLRAGQVEDDPARQLMQLVVDKDADWLRRATEESLAYLQWLSRFAEAEIGEGGKNLETGP